MTAHERISASHEMTARELVDFTRSSEAVFEGNWMALALGLASKLEMSLNEAQHGRSRTHSFRSYSYPAIDSLVNADADADLQEAIREFQVP